MTSFLALPLWFCYRSIDILKEIRNQTLDKLTDLVKLNSRHKRSEIMSDFNFSPSWIIPLSQPITVSHFIFANTITGLILSDLIVTIEHHTTITSHTIPIINKVFHFMFTKLYHEMWIPRCSQLSLVKKTFGINSHNK